MLTQSGQVSVSQRRAFALKIGDVALEQSIVVRTETVQLQVCHSIGRQVRTVESKFARIERKLTTGRQKLVVIFDQRSLL